MAKRKQWTSKEIDELIKWDMSANDFALAYDRTYRSVIAKANSLRKQGYKINFRYETSWTEYEKEIVIRFANIKTRKELANMLGKTERAVTMFINKNKLSNFTKKSFTEFEINYIIENYDKLKQKQIMKTLNRSSSTICTKIKMLKRKGELYNLKDFFLNFAKQESGRQI